MSSKNRLDFVILSDSYRNLQQLPRKINRSASWESKEDNPEGLIFTHSADLIVAEPPLTLPIPCTDNELFIGRRDSAGEFQTILASAGSGIGVFHFTARYLEVIEVPELHEMNCVYPPSIQFYSSRMGCQEEMAGILRPLISNCILAIPLIRTNSRFPTQIDNIQNVKTLSMRCQSCHSMWVFP